MMKQVWFFASGKGGVGKSTLTSALAEASAAQRLRTLLIDADMGLRGLDLILGLENAVLFDMMDCLERRASLDEAIIRHPKIDQLYLMVGGQNSRPKDYAVKALKKMLETLRYRFDLIIIDGPAGLGRGISNFLGLADQYVLVATPDPICLRDSEKTSELIFEKTGHHPWLLLNRVQEKPIRKGLLPKPTAISQSLDMPLLGIVPDVPLVYQASLLGKGMSATGDKRLYQALVNIQKRMQGIEVELPLFEGHLIRRMFSSKRRKYWL